MIRLPAHLDKSGLPLTTVTFVSGTVNAGKSADTRLRNVGVAVEPLVGPAKTVFAVCFNSPGTNVPELVTGDPGTVLLKITPSPVCPTLVTVPPLAPATADQVQSPRKYVELLAANPEAISLTSIGRNIAGAAAALLLGPARNKFELVTWCVEFDAIVVAIVLTWFVIWPHEML
jgi:hypothetical protein